MKKDKEVKRRKVLKTTGLSLGGIALCSGFGTAKREQGVTFSLRGNRENPITARNIKKRRGVALKRFQNRFDYDRSVVLKKFDDDIGEILAYNFVASPEDGISEQVYRHTPVRNEVESQDSTAQRHLENVVERAHNSADEWLQGSGRPGRSSSQASTQETTVGTQGSYPSWSEWDSVADHYDVNDTSYGVVTEDYSFAEDPDGSNAMAVQTGVDIEAGTNRVEHGYSGYYAYEIKGALVKNQWTGVTIDSTSMRDRYPRGPLDSSKQTISADLGIDGSGTGAVGVSYSYTNQIDNITDESSQGDNVGRWQMSLHPWSDAASNNAYYNPGSLAKVYHDSCGSLTTVDVIDIPLTVEFANAFQGNWSDVRTFNYSKTFTTGCW